MDDKGRAVHTPSPLKQVRKDFVTSRLSKVWSDSDRKWMLKGEADHAPSPLLQEP